MASKEEVGLFLMTLYNLHVLFLGHFHPENAFECHEVNFLGTAMKNNLASKKKKQSCINRFSQKGKVIVAVKRNTKFIIPH